jgi:hypothetical protein
MNKIIVTISEVKEMFGQTHVKYQGYGQLGSAHPDFKNAKVGQVYELTIKGSELKAGTYLKTARLISERD